jgi:hypothetical protein
MAVGWYPLCLQKGVQKKQGDTNKNSEFPSAFVFMVKAKSPTVPPLVRVRPLV